jgi:hypothetical protein
MALKLLTCQPEKTGRLYEQAKGPKVGKSGGLERNPLCNYLS